MNMTICYTFVQPNQPERRMRESRAGQRGGRLAEDGLLRQIRKGLRLPEKTKFRRNR